MSFEHPITARFHEVDRVGIVFFGRAFEYAHICFEEMLIAAFDAPADALGHKGFLMPIVHAEADYRRPIRQFDRLVATLDVERLTPRSMTLRTTLRGPDGPGDVRAVVRIKHAFIDAGTFEPTRRPALLDAGLARVGLTPEEVA